jgi:F0F1-type ATP synthase assembly protein I
MSQNGKIKFQTIFKALSTATQAGLIPPACIISAVMLGRWLDFYLGTSPRLLLVMSLLGLLAAFRALWIFIRRL